MRCKFCGWDNPEGKATCEKCNKPLLDSVVYEQLKSYGNDVRPTVVKQESESLLKKTVRECSTVLEQQAVSEEKCPVCGYELHNGVCASCGYSNTRPDIIVKPSKTDSDMGVRKTVRPQRKAETEETFSLIPISEKTGQPEGERRVYKGSSVQLDRGNTAPDNMSITSSNQATINYVDGKWTITDGSSFKTTFVQASREIELKTGDLILLGDQLYRFEL